MTRKCQACDKSDSNNPEVTFHNIPPNPEKRNIWFALLGFAREKVLPKYPYICSDHFLKDDFQYRDNGLKYLKADATPQSAFQLSSSRGPSYDIASDLGLLKLPSMPPHNKGSDTISVKSGTSSPISNSIPPNPEKRNIWFALLGFEKDKVLPKRPHICSDHFLKEDFQYKDNGLKYLKTTATPQPLFQSSFGSDIESHFCLVESPSIPKISPQDKGSDDTIDVKSGSSSPISGGTMNVEALKNVPAVAIIPYDAFYSENESSSDSSSTDTASETKYYGRPIHFESLVSARLNPSSGVMEMTQISSQASDSPTDSASQAGCDASVTRPCTAEPNSFNSVIKQEMPDLLEGATKTEPTLEGARINEQFQSESNSQMQLDFLTGEIKLEIKQEDQPDQIQPYQIQPDQIQPDQIQPDQIQPEIQPDQIIPIASISDEQLMEMLESESPLLTPELLLARGNNYKTRRRYFGDITLDDFETQEERDYHINAQKRIREYRKKIRSLQTTTGRMKKRLQNISDTISMVANVCDIAHIKRVLEAEVDTDESSEDNASNVEEDTHADEINEVPPSSTGGLEENETEIDSFNFSNQVQVTFSSGADTASEDKLKKELRNVARKDIIKSKKINKLNNTIFEKDITIEELQRELNKLKNVV